MLRQESTVDHVHFPHTDARFKFRLAVGEDDSLWVWAENKTLRTQFETTLAAGECRAVIDNPAITTPAFHGMLTQALQAPSEDLGLDMAPAEDGMALTLTFAPHQWATHTFVLRLPARPANRLDVLAAQMDDLLPCKPEIGKWTSDRLVGNANAISVRASYPGGSWPAYWTPQLETTPGLFATDGGTITFRRPGLYRVEAYMPANIAKCITLAVNGKEVAKCEIHNATEHCSIVDVLHVDTNQRLEVHLTYPSCQGGDYVMADHLQNRLLITRLGDHPGVPAVSAELPA
jgi:hypothetical protein